MMLTSLGMVVALAEEPAPPATWVNRWYDGTATHHVVADAPYVFRGRIEAYGFPEGDWWTASGREQGPVYAPAFTATMGELGRETHAHSPYVILSVEVLEVFRGEVQVGARVHVYMPWDHDLGVGTDDLGTEAVFFQEPFVDPLTGRQAPLGDTYLPLMPPYLAELMGIWVDGRFPGAVCPGRASLFRQHGVALTLRSTPETVSALAKANGLTVSVQDPIHYQDDVRDPRPNTLVYERGLRRADGTYVATVDRDGDPLMLRIGVKEREPFSCSDALTYQGLIAEIREGK